MPKIVISWNFTKTTDFGRRKLSNFAISWPASQAHNCEIGCALLIEMYLLSGVCAEKGR